MAGLFSLNLSFTLRLQDLNEVQQDISTTKATSAVRRITAAMILTKVRRGGGAHGCGQRQLTLVRLRSDSAAKA